MFAFETVVTLIATLTTLTLAILIIERNALRRLRLKHSLEVLDLAKKLGCDQAHLDDLISPRLDKFLTEAKHAYWLSFRFLVQTVFGIAVFVGFAGWAYYLLQQNFVEYALVSACFALLGMIIPFVVWRGFSQRAGDIERLLRGVEHYKKTLAQQKKDDKTAKTSTTTVTAAVTSASEPAAVPEDSILRRHYLAHRQAEREVLTHPYPTDSILRRHTDSLSQSSLNEVPANAGAAPTATMTLRDEAIAPQDSILRRHHLAQLQAEREALTDPYPTDSILRRHTDSMIKALLTDTHTVISEPAVTAERAQQPTTEILSETELECRNINKLRAEIEAGLFPRPTDSVLQRHYDALVENEMENALHKWALKKHASATVGARNLH